MEQRIAIIGGGHAAAQVSLQLRRLGWRGKLALFSDEDELPYQRPPLSKAFLTGAMKAARLAFRKQAFYDEQKIELHLGERAVGLDRDKKQFTTTKQKVDYDILILATGGTPRKLPGEGGALYLHNKAESIALGLGLKGNKEIEIIGGGYIGLEVAATARKFGLQVRLFEAAPRILSRVAAPEISTFFTAYHQQKGVQFFLNQQAKPTDKALRLVGIGSVPNLELAERAGLKTDGGIVVNAQQQTHDPAIYAIGDCARAPHPLYESAQRLESVQNANYQATLAAHAICDAPPPAMEVPWFWSDQYDIKLQIAGLSQGYDRILVRGATAPDRAAEKGFAVFYLAKDRVIAADCINRPQEFLFTKKFLSAGQIDLEGLADDSKPLKEIFIF